MGYVCFAVPPLQPWGSLGTGGSLFCPQWEDFCEEMELSYVQELIPIHSSHSFLLPSPTLWISNVIPKQLKFLETISLEWVAPALPLPAAM